MRTTIPRLLAKISQTRSMSEGRRLTVMGAIEVNDQTITDIGQEIEFAAGDVLRVGKREIVLREVDLQE